jgi:ankyrin repeat protein
MSPRHKFAVAALIACLLPAGAAAAAGLPLADAAERGDVAAVRALIAQKSDVNAARIDGTTALHAAVHADRLEIADL